jgi:hypothetical protein
MPLVNVGAREAFHFSLSCPFFYSCWSETIRWIPTGYCLTIDISGALVHYKGA